MQRRNKAKDVGLEVDFYILEKKNKQEALIFTCGLIEKLYTDQATVYVHTSSQAEADHLDHLLWIYRDDSFLPHQIYQDEESFSAPILIGYKENLLKYPNILINLHQDIPSFYSQFNRTIEIVFADPHVQQLGRERYKTYRDQQCELKIYKEN